MGNSVNQLSMVEEDHKGAMEVELESYRGQAKDVCKEQASDVCSVGEKVLLCRGS